MQVVHATGDGDDAIVTIAAEHGGAIVVTGKRARVLLDQLEK